MNFPEIGPAHAPEIEFSKKKLDEFSRNLSVLHPGKLKFRKNFWMTFPGLGNKD